MNKTDKEKCQLLMELDKEFDRVTYRDGAKGWVSYFADEGVMVPSAGEVIRGKEAIYDTMSKAFALKDFSLRWKPIDAEISNDGSMGYTYGDYIRTYKDNEGNIVTSTGRYTSIWGKQKDGSWKITLDIGN